MRTQLALTFVAALFLLPGCRKEETAAPPPPEVAPERDLWAELSALREAGKSNEVVTVLENAFTDEAFVEQRVEVARALIGSNLDLGQLAAAQEAFLTAAAAGDDETDLASAVFGMVESYMLYEGRHEDLIAWCESLLTKGLPEQAKAGVVVYMFEARRALGQIDKILEFLPSLTTAYAPRTANVAVSRLLGSMLRNRQFEEFDRVLAFLAARFPDNKDFVAMAANYGVRGLIAQSKLDEAEKLLSENLDLLGDGVSADLAGQILKDATAKGETELAERLCTSILDRETVPERLLQRIATQWLKLGKAKGDAGETLERLTRVLARTESASNQLRLINEVFYFIVQQGDADAKEQAVNLCEALKPRLEAERDVTQVSLILLDGCFMLEDFDRALRVAEGGIPGRSQAWLEMLIVKIRAHKALVAGNTREAVRWFRQFMAKITTDEEGAGTYVDPVSGDRVSREEVLGLNAVRIAELWQKEGETVKAAAAFAEARDFYQKAFDASEEESAARKRLLEKMKAVPAAE